MIKRIAIVILLWLPMVLMAQTELYKRYARQEGLTVAQVSDFKLADTVQIDVVIVQADDEAAWNRIAGELEIEETSGMTSWLAEADRPERRVGWSGKAVVRVVAAIDRRTVGFYRLETEAELEALIDYQTSQMIANKKKK